MSLTESGLTLLLVMSLVAPIVVGAVYIVVLAWRHITDLLDDDHWDYVKKRRRYF